MRSKVLTFLVACSLGFAEATLGTRQSKTPYFLLIGDSTVAVDGGWGDGLLSYMKDTTRGENRGKSGATTISWKADGRWEELLGTVEANIDEYEPIVTVQFGHNDQKIMELDEFQTHLENIIHGIITAGGTPILITSLTRRTFKDGKVVENLAEWASATIDAAHAGGVQCLDLNLASTNYVNAIGEKYAASYNLADGDATHLRPGGEIVFGRMVLDLLLEAREDLGIYFEADEELSDKISNGEYASGEE